MSKPVCVVTGVGPGTGSALARRFAAGGYRVALLARNAERIGKLESELEGGKAFVCDVSDQANVDATITAIERDLGTADEAWHLTEQDRSAWSYNVEIRPFGEAW